MTKDRRLTWNLDSAFITSSFRTVNLCSYNIPEPWPADKYYSPTLSDRGTPTDATFVGDSTWAAAWLPHAKDYPLQEYIIGWNGTGGANVIGLEGGHQIIAGNEFVDTSYGGSWLCINGTNPRVHVKCNPGLTRNLALVKLAPMGSGQPIHFDGMGPVYIVRADQEGAYRRGDYWAPDYLDHINAGNPRCLRFMGWQSIPEAWQVVTRPVSIDAPRNHGVFLPPDLDVGFVESDDGVAYHCAMPDDHGPGATFYGWVTKAATGQSGDVPYPQLSGTAATLDCGFGPKPILTSSGPVPVQLQNWTANFIPYGGGQYSTFYYDAELDVYFCTPSGGPLRHGYRNYIDLCNQTHRDCWVCMPNLITIDEAFLLGRLLAENLEPGRTAHVEYSNEVWGGVNWGNVYCSWLGRKKFNWDENPYCGQYYRLATLMPKVEAGWLSTGRKREELILAYMGWTVNYDAPRLMRGGDYDAIPEMVALPRLNGIIDSWGYAPYHGGTVVKEWAGQIWQGSHEATRAFLEPLLHAADQYADGDDGQKRAALEWFHNDLLTYNDYWYYQFEGGCLPKWEAFSASMDDERAALGKAPIKICNYEGQPAFEPISHQNLIDCGFSEDEAKKYGTQFGWNCIVDPGRLGVLYRAYRQSDLYKRLCLKWIGDFYKPEYPHAYAQGWWSDSGTDGLVTDPNSPYYLQDFCTRGSIFSFTCDGRYAPKMTNWAAFKEWNDGNGPDSLNGGGNAPGGNGSDGGNKTVLGEIAQMLGDVALRLNMAANELAAAADKIESLNK